MTVVPFTGDRMARTADGTPYERRLDPATVYTLRDADGEPLYIGVSNNAVGRIAAHQRQAWWLEVKTIELLHFEERRDALDHERDLPPSPEAQPTARTRDLRPGGSRLERGRVTALGIQPRLRVGIDAHHFIRTLSGAAVPPPRTAERPPDRKERGPRGSSRRTS